MDRVKAEEIGEHIRGMIVNVNAIKEEDLKELLGVGSREAALGPLVDPTLWQDGDMVEVNNQTRRVLRALLVFKKEVKGIGDFK